MIVHAVGLLRTGVKYGNEGEARVGGALSGLQGKLNAITLGNNQK